MYYAGSRSAVPRRARVGARRVSPALLDLDASALLFELRLYRGGLLLGDAGLDGLRRAVHQVLRLLEAEAGQLAHDLDHLDLLGAGFAQDDVELGLLLDRR